MRHTTTLVAHNTVHHESAYPSRLMLPVTGELPAAVEADVAATRGRDVLLSAGPNPFATRAAFRWRLDAPCRVDLRIVDITGRQVRTSPVRSALAASTDLVCLSRSAARRLIQSPQNGWCRGRASVACFEQLPNGREFLFHLA